MLVAPAGWRFHPRHEMHLTREFSDARRRIPTDSFALEASQSVHSKTFTVTALFLPSNGVFGPSRDESGDEAPRSRRGAEVSRLALPRLSVSLEVALQRGRGGFGACAGAKLRGGVGGRALCARRALRVYPHAVCEPGWWMGGLRGAGPRAVLASAAAGSARAPARPRPGASSAAALRHVAAGVAPRAGARASARARPSRTGGPHPVGGDLGRALGCWAAASPDRSVCTDQVKALSRNGQALAAPPACRCCRRRRRSPPGREPGRGRTRHHSCSRAAHAEASSASQLRGARAGVDRGRRLAREVIDRAYDDPRAPPRPEQLKPMSQRPSPATEPAASRARPRTPTPLPHTFAAAAAPTLHGHGDPPTRPGGHRRRTSSATGGRARRPRAQAQQQSSAEGASSRGRCAQLRALPQLSAPAGAAPAQRGMRKRGTSTRSVSRWRSRRGCRCTGCAASNGTCCTIWRPRNPTRSARPARARARLVRSCLPRAVAGCADRGRRRDCVRGRGHARRFPPRRLLPALRPPRPPFRHALTLLALVCRWVALRLHPGWAPACSECILIPV